MVKIMLDAGHGYQTAGKGVPGLKEYEFNKGVVNHIINILNGYQDVTLYSCYSDTRDVPLKERTDMANGINVDCYASIHGNAGPTTARGIETFIYPKAGEATYNLARSVHDHTINITGMVNRGVKRVDFHVLRETKMNAFLIECGFMTNPEDLALMLTDEYRRKVAQGVSNGLIQYYGLKAKPVPAPQAPTPAPSNTIYRVQVGAFANKDNADRLVAELKAKGYSAIITQ
jgi:N-acetylmuramoyl-L-alanine amidase